MTPTAADIARKRRILARTTDRTLEQIVADATRPDAAARGPAGVPTLRQDLEAEAASDDPQKLVTRDLLAMAAAAPARETTGFAFLSSADVIIVPGFLASELADEKGDSGLIWIDPRFVLTTDDSELLLLGLGDADADADGVEIRPRGALPLIYGGLKYALEFSGYDARIFGYDWRKRVDVSAALLAERIRDRAAQRPLHIIAHSQGSLVARRAIQMLGPDLARRVVDSLVLLGPATAGSFSAAFALAGTHDLIDTVRRFGINAPPGFDKVLQSMSGLYQLLPWRADPVNDTPTDRALEWVRANREAFKSAAFWAGVGTSEPRLRDEYAWAESIDASFLNDRTSIILGDAPTVGGVMFGPPDENGKRRLVPDPDFDTTGDGTVPDSFARVAGVARVFKARGAEHMALPATWSVIMAVRAILADRHPRIDPFALGDYGLGAAPPAGRAARADYERRKLAAEDMPFLADEKSNSLPTPAEFFGSGGGVAAATPADATPWSGDVPPPRTRRLRVFSFDPLFAAELDNLGAEQVTVELPWEFADGDRLQPGPVGEYLEVVDFDASSRCFYPPVDLNHRHALAQDGVPVSEGDPRFHQQMVYAVAMNTIRQFEVALGRVALWAPNLEWDKTGRVIPRRPGDEYVGRLRVYPHAMRAGNAFYSPPKKALLFGYFPAAGPDVGRNLPGGVVFTALSYDIIAHETTHALLDGLHRHFTQPSNPDVFAFHEAFADLVALLQHFTHPDVLRHQVAKARGDLKRETSLGVLAAQFGEASGRRAALREYIGRVKKDPKTGDPILDRSGRKQWVPVAPDAAALRNTTAPHDRGAILVAAVFRAFLNIYENRVRDLRRIATGGTGRLPDGDLHPDLVNRMAVEAAKAAKHLLRMCVRALDYVPPVDVTFGEYLRALITADYDLVRDDDLRYRVAVIAAFRDWGIYPAGVASLSVGSLLWEAPDWRGVPAGAATAAPFFPAGLRRFFADNPLDEWGARTDRRAAYMQMTRHGAKFHAWLADERNLPRAFAGELGLCLDPAAAPHGIGRDNDGIPTFHVHMFRPCRRIGPDGQELTDVVVEVLQRRRAYFDDATQAAVDAAATTQGVTAAADFYFRGGCTLILDPEAGVIRYCVKKSIDSAARLRAERDFRRSRGATGNYLAPPDEDNPFAVLHADD